MTNLSSGRPKAQLISAWFNTGAFAPAAADPRIVQLAAKIRF
jgi:hypothetical protein